MRDYHLAKRAVRWLARRAFPREKRHSLVGQSHLWKIKRDFQIAFLKNVGLKPEHYLLDIGCGTLRGGIPMIRYLDEGHYLGLDTRPEALEEARRELAAGDLTGKAPLLICVREMASLDLGRSVDCAWAFSVLFHMTDEILHNCFRLVHRHLKPDGAFYANVHVGSRPPGAWREFPVIWRPLASYQQFGELFGLSVEDVGPLRAFGHVTGIAEQDEQRVLKMRPSRVQ